MFKTFASAPCAKWKTDAYRGDKSQTISILNEALATPIVCVLRYVHHYFMATGVRGKSVADEFKEHADAEREHADQIAERIQQLGGKPDFKPRNLLQRSASQYVEGETLPDMIREDLVAERMVIEVYTDMIRHFRDDDPTTRVMMEGILKDEEEHASDLTDLRYIVNPQSGETEGQDPGTHPLDLYGDRQQKRRQEVQAGGRNQNSTRVEMVGNRQALAGWEVRAALHASKGRDNKLEVGKQRRPPAGRSQQGGRGPLVSQREAGTTFAASKSPNPPQPIRNRGQQRGKQPRNNGGNQPLQPAHFRANERSQQQQAQFGGRGGSLCKAQSRRGVGLTGDPAAQHA